MKTNVPVKHGQLAAAPRPYGGPLLGLHREVDRLFDEFARGFGAFGSWPEFRSMALAPTLTPMMDVSETEKEIEVTTELPGMEEKDVAVTVADGILTVRGEKKSGHEEKGKDLHMVERGYGAFSRSLELPAGVDMAAIKAGLDKGVLTVTIPKKVAEVRKVPVKAAA